MIKKIQKRVFNITEKLRKCHADSNMTQIILHIILIIVVSLFVWYQSLHGWFLGGNEAHHLFSNLDFSFPSLIRTHSLLYFVSFSLFKWNPFGWYALTLFFHIVAGILSYWFFVLITRRKNVSFMVSVGFLCNVSYIDIVVWGSFNALYPFSLCVLISSFILFFYFRERKKYIFYIALYPLFFLGLLVREIVLVLPFLLFVFDILFFVPLNKKNWRNLFAIHSPLIAALFLFFLFRANNGGDPSDYVDERHRLRMGLLENRMYVEYIFRASLGFFKKIAGQVIPFPLTNVFREAILVAPREVIRQYFFPILGVLYFLFLSKAVFLIKKNILFKAAVFSFLFMIILTAFFSFAMPETDTTLSGMYSWNGARYHYFSFWGLFSASFFVAISFLEKVKKKAISLFIFFLVVQIYFIWSITFTTAKTIYGPAREFHKQMAQLFPNNKDLYFYVYPHASPLGDYLDEWNYLRAFSPSDYNVDSQFANVAMTLQKIRNKTLEKEKVHFLDYDSANGIIDKTNDVFALASIIVPETFHQNDLQVITLRKQFPVEIPYEIEIRMRADIVQKATVNEYDAYLRDQFVNKIIVSASNTIKISEIDEHPLFSAKNLHDNNFGVHSLWIAEDTKNAKGSITVDLIRERSIEGFLWSNPSGITGLPSTYTIFVSTDKKSWKKIKAISGNKEKSKIEKFTRTTARYVRMDIEGTLIGDPPYLDEVAVVESISMVGNAKDMTSLTDNAIKNAVSHGTNITVGTIIVGTKSQKREYDYTKRFLISLDGTMRTYIVPLNDSETFSIPGEFLSRNIVNLSFSLPEVTNYHIEYVKIRPIFPTVDQ